MSTESTDIAASTAGDSAASTGSTVDQAKTSDVAANAVEKSSASAIAPAGAAIAAGIPGEAPIIDGKPAYIPNFKYKAALQEKELDPFFHSLVKDADSEKKVKDLFTKVDAFDFVKGRKEQIEQQHGQLQGDFEFLNQTVNNVIKARDSGDLKSVFRQLNITKESLFKYVQQELQVMEMPPEQQQQYAQFEQAQMQKMNLEQQVQGLQKQYEHQAVQARAMQLDVALSRPEVANFATAWDANGEPGSFKSFVIEEAKKVFYDTRQDLSPEEAIGLVMKRFGKFLNTGDAVMPPPQAVPQTMSQQAKPVIPNITGKAASPIKKVPRSLDDLKKLAKEMSG